MSVKDILNMVGYDSAKIELMSLYFESDGYTETNFVEWVVDHFDPETFIS